MGSYLKYERNCIQYFHMDIIDNTEYVLFSKKKALMKWEHYWIIWTFTQLISIIIVTQMHIHMTKSFMRVNCIFNQLLPHFDKLLFYMAQKLLNWEWLWSSISLH